ncbi:MAG: LTA synthase family protein [Bulleidia sp.]
MNETIKKWIRPIPSCILGAMIISRYPEFAAYDNHGTFLFVISLIMCTMCVLMSLLPDIRDRHSRKFNLLSAFLFGLTPFLIVASVEILNGNMLWDIEPAGNIFMNALVAFLLYLTTWALCGSIRLSMCAVTIALEIFGIANFYVKQFKGSPLLPWDIGSIGTAAAVAGSYTYEIGVQILVSLVFCLLIWNMSRFVIHNPKSRTYRTGRCAAGMSLACVVGVFYGSEIISRTLGAAPDFFNQTRGYESKGALAEFFVNTKYMSLSKPDGYDAAKVETDVLSAIDPDAGSILNSDIQVDVHNPNVIVIMNESYSDLSVIGDFDVNQDYMPYVNSLIGTENVIEGNCYVSTIGTGTSNTEYEFLTGNTMAFLPYGSNAYDRYVDHPTQSLVSTLASAGYQSEVMHPYYRADWNRPAVYEDFGFDDFTAYEDRGDWKKLRRYVSDASDFEVLKEMYENRNPNEPFFMFNITMQNHSSYDQTDYNWTQEITLENMKGEYPETEQYLSLIRETDRAFEDLIDYFKNQEEPTIILMFGDHQPFIENAFYEEVMGKPLNDLSDEENQKRYITRFVMWANYDIPEGWIDCISANYLSVLLAQCTNTPMTPYMEFLNTMYDQVPVITALGCLDHSGNYFKADEQNPYSDILSIYRNADYNLLRENEKRADSLFETEQES